MNAKVKKIIYSIAAFFAGIFAFILRAKICDNRDAANSIGDRVEELKRRADEQQSNNSATIEGIEGALNTIDEIRAKQKILEECDSSDGLNTFDLSECDSNSNSN